MLLNDDISMAVDFIINCLDGMLKTIIGQNEKIIRFLKKFIA